MAQIHVLDSETIDKIAAGEVVERPASIVKELVENAIDAKADAITVEAKEGGISYIRVTDNGVGMEKNQIRTAFLRHATSKIQTAEDLSCVSSLGFRGEALSSIAAVSQIEMITKTRESLTGTRLLMEGAMEQNFQEIGAPEGTTFIVRNLFFNTPVRRKFLKQPATEGGYITELMEHLALSRPDISFKFILGNQTKFHTSGNGDLKEVIYRIYGREIAKSLIPIQQLQNGICVEGYLGKPVLVRSNRNYEIYFINRRFIKSNVIARAVEEGYKEYLMQHKFPFCVLHISMDTDQVDVNVHPTKMDVRFSNTVLISEIISKAVQISLKNREMIPEGELSETNKKVTDNHPAAERVSSPEPFEVNRSQRFRVEEETNYRAQIPNVKEFEQHPVWDRVKNEAETDLTGMQLQISLQKDDEFVFLEEPEELGSNEIVNTNSVEIGEATEVKPEVKQEIKPEAKQEVILEERQIEVQQELTKKEEKAEQLNLFEEKMLTMDNKSRYHIIGQVFDTYWLIQFEDKLFIIDQHAAHEKVKYERLLKQYQEKAVISQALMPPIIVSVSGQEEMVLEEYRDCFSNLGFTLENFGGKEYALRSVPVDLYGCNEKELFLEVLDELSDGGLGKNPRVIEEKIASMSCKAAVKGNNRLSAQEASVLIDELLTLENPYHCPHGRPTIITISKYEMEKKFKRIL